MNPVPVAVIARPKHARAGTTYTIYAGASGRRAQNARPGVIDAIYARMGTAHSLAMHTVAIEALAVHAGTAAAIGHRQERAAQSAGHRSTGHEAHGVGCRAQLLPGREGRIE